jgi:hypothetical protein
MVFALRKSYAAHVADGSIATEEVEAAQSCMSALPPKADKWIDASVCQLCADGVEKGLVIIDEP